MSDPADGPLPTGDDVRRLAARLVGDELVVVPVRHHSPACARAVATAFERWRPSTVLVEGPRSLDPLVPLLCHAEAAYPLAVYTWLHPTGTAAQQARTPPAQGAYVPFCDHSPELVALQRAHAAGVPVRFCDLELAEVEVAAGRARGARDAAPDGSDGVERSLLAEEPLRHSDTLQLLADRLGCVDHEDLWELLFEADEQPLQTHLARVAAYCLLARRDRTPAELAADGTEAREAEMVHHVREALAARRPGDGPVLVVLGGFHAVALPDLLDDPPPRPDLPVPHAETGAALIRYDDLRLERLNGYASGMTAPAWHRRVWERREAGEAAAAAQAGAVLDVLLDVGAILRSRHRTPVATPSLAAAHEHALLLAGLRDHPAPLRTDLVDAVTSCLVKGDVDAEGALVRRVLHDVLTGDRVGRVPPGAGTPPLVRDTLERLRALRLDVDGHETTTVHLDLYRSPAHRRTSRALHGLRLLGVPFARHAGGPDFVRGTGLARLREQWQCLWSPAAEGALVEASHLGSTLPEAVTTAFGRLLAEATSGGQVPSSPRATALLAHAAVLGLHARARDAVVVVRDALAAEPSFPEAVRATGGLVLLAEGREPLEATRLTELPDLVAAGWARSLYLARGLRGEECPPAEAAEALSRLRELLASPAGAGLDAAPFWAVVDTLRREHEAAFVRGAAAGLASTAGRLDDAALARDVRGHLAGTSRPEDAVGFLAGLLATAREAVWQEVGVVPALDDRLGEWEEATFLAHLPELRLAFSSLTPRETDRVAALVAEHRGLAGGAGGLGPLLVRGAGAEEVAAARGVAAEVAEVLRGEGLGEWAS
ncbi:DUF5682 family protein [Nocardioides litoris]|uniref:DUF5682 family protein n=1 Tax=Nocardioides litoris TaxID=1926648 RepID=UPI00112406C0|nr:DUF5682 family protein [Nocardioides litoris]